MCSFRPITIGSFSGFGLPKNTRLDYYRDKNPGKLEFFENIDSEMPFPNRYFASFFPHTGIQITEWSLSTGNNHMVSTIVRKMDAENTFEEDIFCNADGTFNALLEKVALTKQSR